MDTPSPQPEAVPTAPAAGKAYVFSDYLFQFITITAGVLIALLVNGLVEWNGNRTLVAEARSTIASEIAGNKTEVETVLGGNPARMVNLNAALSLANDLLASRTPAVNALNLGYNIADLSSAAWDSAARTGALSHMDYALVQQYSRLYALQELFADQQARAMEQLTLAMAILSDGFDPTKSKISDLEQFRERVLQMKAGLTVEEQLAKRLVESYAKMLGTAAE